MFQIIPSRGAPIIDR